MSLTSDIKLHQQLLVWPATCLVLSSVIFNLRLGCISDLSAAMQSANSKGSSSVQCVMLSRLRFTKIIWMAFCWVLMNDRHEWHDRCMDRLTQYTMKWFSDGIFCDVYMVLLSVGLQCNKDDNDWWLYSTVVLNVEIFTARIHSKLNIDAL